MKTKPKKKYNNNSDRVKDWTTLKLKSEARSLDDMIYNVECYGIRDCILLNMVLKELEKRGVEPKLNIKFE